MSDEKSKSNEPPVQEFAGPGSGIIIHDDFERFSQKDEVFCRSFWDPSVRSTRSEVFYETYRRPLKHYRDVDGFTQKDYSFRNASWYLPDIFAERFESEDRREGFLDAFTTLRDRADRRRELESKEDVTREIKRVAHAFGANLVGVTARDDRWIYSSAYSAKANGDKPNDVPEHLDTVIVVATAMDHDLIRTVPSALSGAATGAGYAKDIVSVLSLAQYIRNLGFDAVESLNDTATAIPYAIQAGLGEYGRHGMLITKEYGPRVRLGKIFTDLPLQADRPIRFGVREFCGACRRCANACPPQAIAHHAPSRELHNRSNLVGVTKWTTDAEKCFGFWVNQNSDCSICIRVCPYNKDYSHWYYRLGRWLASTPLRVILPRVDAWMGYGRRYLTKWWWDGASGSRR